MAVENSQYGVAAARAAGMRVVELAGGLAPRTQLEAADAVIIDVAELAAAVARLTAPAPRP